MYKKQVEKTHYDFLTYVGVERWVSFYHQIVEVLELAKHVDNDHFTILEIGIGNGVTKAVLKQLGFNIKTVDIDADLEPDFVDHLPNLKIIATKKFDCIICFEVLEHIKFEDVEAALRRMSEISPNLIISVPNQGKFQQHDFNGEHYWELDSQETSVEMFENCIKRAGLKIDKTYITPENTYHKFYILKLKTTQS